MSPNELFLKRKLKIHFHLLLPNTKKHVTSKQSDQKQQHDKHARPCSLFPGSLVMIRDYTGSSKWIPGTILRKLRPMTFDVETTNGRIVKWHVDQLHFQKDCADNSEVKMTNKNSDVLDNHQYPPSEDNTVQQDISVHTEPPECCYPQRERHVPDRFVPKNDGQMNS